MPYRPTGRPRGRPAYPGLLTPAEQRVLDGVRRGLTNQQISDELGLSPNTVKTHIATMLSKLYLEDRHELASWQPDRELVPVGSRRWYAGAFAALKRLLGSVPPPVLGGSLLAALILGTMGTLAFLVLREGGEETDPAQLLRATVEAPAPPGTATPTGSVVVPTVPGTPTAAPATPAVTSTESGTGTPVGEEPATETPGPQETPGPLETPSPTATLPVTPYDGPPPFGFHPWDVRTGVEAVDTLLAAAERSDLATLASLVTLTEFACTNAGPNPDCLPGEPEGTTFVGFPSGACDGGTVRDVNREALMWDLAVHATWVYGVVRHDPPTWGRLNVRYSIALNSDETRLGGMLLMNAEGAVVGRTGCGYVLGENPDYALGPVEVEPIANVTHQLLVIATGLNKNALTLLRRCEDPCWNSVTPRGAAQSVKSACNQFGRDNWRNRPAFDESEHGTYVEGIASACGLFDELRAEAIPLRDDATPTPAWREALEQAVAILSGLDGVGPVATPEPIPYPTPSLTPTPTWEPPTDAEVISGWLLDRGRLLADIARDGSVAIWLNADPSSARGTVEAIAGACAGKDPVSDVPNRPGYDPAVHGDLLASLQGACGWARAARQDFPVDASWEEWLHVINRVKHRFAYIEGLTITFAFGQRVRVDTGDGDRMILRERPGLDAPELDRVENGTEFVIADGPVEGDGYYWWRFESGGWAADANLAAVE